MWDYCENIVLAFDILMRIHKYDATQNQQGNAEIGTRAVAASVKSISYLHLDTKLLEAVVTPILYLPSLFSKKYTTD